MLPKERRHSVTLKDGRALAYYTFDTKIQAAPASGSKPLHPVLYLHGFPGTGREGAMAAQAMADHGLSLIGVDRPGFGYSDPVAIEDEDERIQCVVEGLWQLLNHLSFTSFSVIGVSGGGPFAMAVLESFLRKQEAGEMPPQLVAVVDVAGVCCSGGVESMMKANQAIFKYTSTRRQSWISWAVVKLNFVVMSNLVWLLPNWMLLKSMPTSDIPGEDAAVVSDPVGGPFIIDSMRMALRQGAAAGESEASTLFRKGMAFEERLRSAVAKTRKLPSIGIFQGQLDVNVPPDQTRYVHEHILGSKSRYVVYPDMGHISIIKHKAQDFAKFIAECQ